MRIIDADRLKEEFLTDSILDKCVRQIIDNTSTLEISRVVDTAHWVFDPDGMDWGLAAWVCSKCKNKNDMIPTHVAYSGEGLKRVENPYTWAGSQYCPCCGRKMIPEDTENDT